VPEELPELDERNSGAPFDPARGRFSGQAGAPEVKIKTDDGDVVTNRSGVLFAVALNEFL
jgi:hypothetical protein